MTITSKFNIQLLTWLFLMVIGSADTHTHILCAGGEHYGLKSLKSYYIFGEIKMFASRVQINIFRKKLPLKWINIFRPTKYIVYILLHYVLIFRAFSARWSTPIGPEASWKTFWSGRKNQTHRCRFVQATGATHFNYLTLNS